MFVKKKSLFLAVVLLLSVALLTVGSISAFAVSPSEYTVLNDNFEHLGYGFNALGNNELGSSTSLTTSKWIDESNSTGAVRGDAEKGVIVQGGEAVYTESAAELMEKFGLNASNSINASLPIKVLTLGLKTKFALNVDYSKTSAYEEAYYMYTYKAVTEQYWLDSTNGASPYALNSAFLTAVKSIDLSSSDSIDAFFNKYGTHMLTSYCKGGEIQLTASAINTSNEVILGSSSGLQAEVSANVEGVNASVAAARAIEVSFGKAANNSSVVSQAKWKTLGGEQTYIDSFSGKDITINDDAIKGWVDSLRQSNTLLPETTVWVPVWEVLPATAEYSAIKDALYTYYMEQANTSNSQFFSQFCTYRNKYTVSGYTYVSPTGYVAQYDSATAETAVAPGSTVAFHINSSEKLRFSVEGPASIDRNGVLLVNADAANDKQITAKVIINGSTAPLATFTVKKEGNNGTFAGGYGTEKRPYLIATPDQFNAIRTFGGRSNGSTYFLQTTTLDFSGKSTYFITNFAAHYDGNGYSIKNWVASSAGNSQVGMFANNTGEIKNLTLNACKITSATVSGTSMTVGLLCGINNGTIDNIVISNCKLLDCTVGSQDSDKDYTVHAGMFAGDNNEKGKITRCGVTGSEVRVKAQTQYHTADAYAAGIAGKNAGIIEDCYSRNNMLYAECRGKVTTFLGAWTGGSTGWAQVGGITAKLTGTGSMKRCLGYKNTISVKEALIFSWHPLLGSLVAENVNGGNVSNCYSEANDQLVGNSESSTVGMQKVGSITVSLVNAEDHWVSSAAGPVIRTYTSIQKAGNPQTDYVWGDLIDYRNLIVNGTMPTNGGSSSTKTPLAYYAVSDKKPSGANTTVTITGYGGLKTSYTVKAVEKTATEIKMEQLPKTMYFVNEPFDSAMATACVTYNDGSTEILGADQLSFEGFSSKTSGEKRITVKYGALQDTYAIEVVDIVPSELEVLTLPTKVLYYTGDSLSLAGLSLRLTKNNGETETVTNGFTASEFDSSKEGRQTITISYAGLTTELNVDVINLSVSSIAIATAPKKTGYFVGDEADLADTDGLSVKVTYNSGTTKTIDSGFAVTFPSMDSAGKKSVTVTYCGKETSYSIQVEAVKIVSIAVKNKPKTAYWVGDTFTTSGLSLTAGYNNGTTKEIWSGFTAKVDGYDEGVAPQFAATGELNVKVFYIENDVRVSTTYTVTVSPIELIGIEMSKTPTKRIYKTGERFSDAGMVLLAVYNNKTVEEVSPDYCTYDFSTAGEKEVGIWYSGMETTLSVTVKNPDYIMVTKAPAKVDYYVGDTVDLTGMEVSAYYFDGTSEKITNYKTVVPELNDTGNAVVLVSYGDLNASVSLHVTEDPTRPEIVIVPQTGNVFAGREVRVKIQLKNNPGVASLQLKVSYDSNLTLTKIEYNSEIGGQAQQPESLSANPVTLNWINGIADSEGDFVFATLTFMVSDDAQIASTAVINATYNPDSVYNIAEENITFKVQSGMVSVAEYLPGDINGDGSVNNKDATRLFQYLSDWEVEVNALALDVNGDGSVNNKDFSRLFQYLSDWNVEIH